MLPNRVSYFLKLKGSSIALDSACSTSAISFEHGYRAVKYGDCERAIVIGSNMCLHQGYTAQITKMGVLSRDGICRPFDKDANGYVRSEAVCVVILEKAKTARRIYSQVVHVKSNCDGYTDQGITFPSSEAQKDLLKQFYEECKIPTHFLSYLEAHGTGTKVGDPQECHTIDQVLTKDRQTSLLVGAVKACLGHTEISAGLASIIKCNLALENGIIPPNINYNMSNEKMLGIIEGRMKIVVEKTKFQDDKNLIGINSFGFGGTNCHILLRGLKHRKNEEKHDNRLPYVICVSGRTSESVTMLLDSIKEHKYNVEYIHLLHHIFSKKFDNHLYRGYIILKNNVEISRSINNVPQNLPQLYVIFGEMQNWYVIFKNFYKLAPFQEPFMRIQKLLSDKFSCLEHTIFTPDDEIRKSYNVLGKAIVQICMAFFLKAVIHDVKIVGDSFGELVSTCDNNLFKLEEILKLAIMLNEKMDKINMTLQLKQNVNGAGKSNKYDYNFRKYQLNVKTIKRNILEQMFEVQQFSTLSDLKKETERIACIERIVNSILQPDCYQLMEIKDVILIRIGSKISEDSDNNFRSYSFDGSFQNLLQIFGSLYELGFNIDIRKIYPQVTFPISKGSPRLESKILWKHRSYAVPCMQRKKAIYQKAYIIDINSSEWEYLMGYNIDGQVLFPPSGYLCLVWELLSKDSHNLSNVLFENCTFLKSTILSQKKPTNLVVTMNESGFFEITENGSLIVTGTVCQPPNTQLIVPHRSKSYISSIKDIYKEFRLRGYYFSGPFQAIKVYDHNENIAEVNWNSRLNASLRASFISFLDNLFQIKLVNMDTRALYIPNKINKLIIVPEKHFQISECKSKGDLDLPVYYSPEADLVRTGAIEIQGFSMHRIQRKKYNKTPILERHVFISNNTALPMTHSIRVNTQIIIENLLPAKLQCVELINEYTDSNPIALSPILIKVFEEEKLVLADIKIQTNRKLETRNIPTENINLSHELSKHTIVIASKLLENAQMMNIVLKSIKENGYIISRESIYFDVSSVLRTDITILTVHRTEFETILLLNKKQPYIIPVCVKITHDDEYKWIGTLKTAIKFNERVIVYAEDEPESGLLGFVNCLRREPASNHVYCVFNFDKASSSFDHQHEKFHNQLLKNMAVNIYKNKTWGTYRHLPLEQLNDISNEHCYVQQIEQGNLSSLQWIHGPLKEKQMVGEAEHRLINVHYTAINTKDSIQASGIRFVDTITDRKDQDGTFGLEFSGTDNRGNKVMGVVASSALATMVIADSDFLWYVPEEWNLEEAVTVPVIYIMTIYALEMCGRIKQDYSILVHSGAGALGQAAVRYALHLGCTVFTIEESETHKKHVQQLFPQIPYDYIGNSYDMSFKNMIMKKTKGKGVNLILNSLVGEKLLQSVRCLSKEGTFLHNGELDVVSSNTLKLELLKQNCSFSDITFDKLLQADPEIKQKLAGLLRDCILTGTVKPIDRTVFKHDEIEKAFNYFDLGNCKGKVIIKIRNQDNPSTRIKGKPRYYCDPKKSYIIVGGLGGFGLELADWLILRKAKKLVFVTTTGIKDGYQKMRIRMWKSYGVIIRISICDVSICLDCKQVIEEAQQLGPVGGIFNLAANLRDCLFENQTLETFEIGMIPKATATKHLDKLSRLMCPELTDFVVFSSGSCGRGNGGQTNYGMANSVMERICEQRFEEGYPGLAIQWGAIGEVGMLTESTEKVIKDVGGTLLQHIFSCLQQMDLFLLQKSWPIVGSMIIANKTSKFSTELSIMEVIAGLLGITDLKSVSYNSTLAELGMDSIIFVEVKKVLESQYELFLKPQDMRNLTLSRLSNIENDQRQEK